MKDVPPGTLDISLDKVSPLSRAQRDALLDLVLAWGSLDGAVGLFLSHLKGLSPSEGAAAHGELATSANLHAAIKILKTDPGYGTAASTLRKLKKRYDKHSHTRNLVVHGRVAGAWTDDPHYLVVLRYRKHSEGHLEVLLVPVSDLREATEIASQMFDILMAASES